MATLPTDRTKKLKVKLKAALIECKIRARSKNAADRALAKVSRQIEMLKGKLGGLENT